MSSCGKIETGRNRPCVTLKFQGKKEHRLMMLIRGRHPFLFTTDIRYEELRLSQCAFFDFYFTSRGCLSVFQCNTLCVIHNIASCLSAYGCGISKKCSPLRLWGQHPRVCLSIFLQHTCCGTKIFGDVNFKANKMFLHISHLDKWNRIWFSTGNHGYLHPHYFAEW